MRFLLPILSLAVSLPSLASPLVTSYADALRSIEGALGDIEYLDKNADNCTRFGAQLRTQFLAPIAEELAQHRERLSALTVFAPSTPNCTYPSTNDFFTAAEAASTVRELVKLRLTQAETPQGQFFGRSGDQVMDLALEAAPGYPSCVPEEADNPRSTRELRTYYEMKAKFVALVGALESMIVEAGKPTAPICRI